MAAGRLPNPGTEYGPCEARDCGHKDCAETRRMAAESCNRCGEAIGYDVRYYETSCYPAPDSARGLGHASCLEAEADAKAKALWDSRVSK